MDGQTGTPNTMMFVATCAVLLGVVAGFIFYLFVLQKRFHKGCQDSKQMEIFFQSPAGLPSGTIRSVLALLIVTVSLIFIALQAFRGLPFPDALTAVLGSVIGFYFGSRATSKGQDEALQNQVKQLQTERDQVVAEKDSGQAQEVLKKVQKGIALTKMVSSFLPDDQKKKYGGILSSLEQGVDMVQNLSNVGNASEAVSKATEVFQLFKGSNPVKGIVEKASQSFGNILGTAIPAMSVISALVGVSTKLAGVAYQKWKARILHLPFSPAVIPLDVVDANTGFVLFLNSPIFKKAFVRELEGNDRKFMKSAVKLFLRHEDTDALWEKFQKRFESREQFEDGLDEFRRAAATVELKNAIDDSLVAEVGGAEKLMATIDQLRADPDASEDLDKLVTVVEGLQQNGEPVQTIFNKAREEISS